MTKKDALNIVFSCAISYKENLAGRSLLFVTADKHKVVRGLEVTFDSSNFLHMTGFKLSNKEIGANNFLSMCCDKRLSETDFEFAADGTTEMKLRVLPDLVQKHLSAKMVGDYACDKNQQHRRNHQPFKLFSVVFHGSPHPIPRKKY